MFKNNSQGISFNSIFFGSEQSKYAGIALFGTIFILCLAILFSSSKIPIDQRFAFVLFILIVSAPSILMSLFELTCIVTGGNSTTRWWCWILAWVISVIIILYCIIVVISLISSMAGYDVANQRAVLKEESKNDEDVDLELANGYANEMLKENKIIKNSIEKSTVTTPLVKNDIIEPQEQHHTQHHEKHHTQHHEQYHSQPQVHPQVHPQAHPQAQPQMKGELMGFDSESSGYAPLQ
tara:strand:- start:20566 stop:21276 length:711 start_codon:yes stop_codon:yes gene_type:complete